MDEINCLPSIKEYLNVERFVAYVLKLANVEISLNLEHIAYDENNKPTTPLQGSVREHIRSKQPAFTS